MEQQHHETAKPSKTIRIRDVFDAYRAVAKPGCRLAEAIQTCSERIDSARRAIVDGRTNEALKLLNEALELELGPAGSSNQQAKPDHPTRRILDAAHQLRYALDELIDSLNATR